MFVRSVVPPGIRCAPPGAPKLAPCGVARSTMTPRVTPGHRAATGCSPGASRRTSGSLMVRLRQLAWASQ